MYGPYLTPEQKIRQRHNWFLEADRLGNVRLAGLRLGTSCKTFYEWRRRFRQAKGRPPGFAGSLPSPPSSQKANPEGPDAPILALRD